MRDLILLLADAASNQRETTIPLPRLAVAFVPVAVVLAVHAWWSLGVGRPALAAARMTLQLLLVGYILVVIFEAQTPWIVLLTLTVMMAAAGWIAMRSLGDGVNGRRFAQAIAAIALGGLPTLLLVTQGVLGVTPWYAPREMVTLGSMIFANSMNAVSLAAERFRSETVAGKAYLEARNTAVFAALIPLTNSMLAVGVVSLPGMMTGKVLEGASPLDAARYQIMVMCMVFGAGGIAAAIYLQLQREVHPALHDDSNAPA